MKSIQQIIYKHFKDDKEINILYLKSGSDYEKGLLNLPYNLFEIPKEEINPYSTLGFDLIISQGQEQLKEISKISHFLHIPIIHIEPEYNMGGQVLFAEQYLFMWNTQAQSWGKTDFIMPMIEAQPNSTTRDLSCIYLDVDQQTQQIGQAIAQKYPVKQIHGESKDFSQCGILVNLVANPSAQQRVLTAFSHGTIVITWNSPYFQEILFDKQTGLLANNPEELIQKIDWAMSNLTSLERMHKTILQVIGPKFGQKQFNERWKQMINKHVNNVYKGVML